MLSVGETEFSATTHRLKTSSISITVLCTYTFEMGSSNPSVTTESYACAVVVFLAGIISSTVDSTFERIALFRRLSSGLPSKYQSYRGPLNIFLTENKKPSFKSSLLMKSVKYEIVTRALSPFFSFAVTL
jgi:hypothetical protein